MTDCAQRHLGLSLERWSAARVGHRRSGMRAGPAPAPGHLSRFARPAVRRTRIAHQRSGPLSMELTMYTAKGTLNRDDQLRKYSPLVRRLAHHMIAKLPPSVEVDDLIQVGMIGLTEAIARFRAHAGRAVRDLCQPAHPRRHARRAARRRLDEPRLAQEPEGHRAGGAPAAAEAAPRAAGIGDRQGAGHEPGRLPAHAGQGARHPAGLPGRHQRSRRRRRRFPGPPHGR